MHMDRFQVQAKLGEGTFGVVLKAQELATGEYVALKKIRLRRLEEGLPKSALREIKALEVLQHPNIIRLREVFADGATLVLVFDYMVSDLDQLLRRVMEPLSEAHIKTYMRMLLAGLAECHENRILHRDLKPGNLLLSATGELKIADFGLARVLRDPSSGPYSLEVATRWYKPPEILFGSRKYDEAVDLWAVGCILGELLGHCPLFPGINDIDQLFRIIGVLGSPTEEQWPDIHELPDFQKIDIKPVPAVPLSTVLPNASPDALDLLSKLLMYDPSRRIRAESALQHSFFFSAPLPSHPSDLPSVPPARSKPKDFEVALDQVPTIDIL